MCSNEDFGDGESTIMQPNKELEQYNLLESTCKKCGSVAAVKLTYKEAQCKNCFLYYVRHKFRANLGSTKILPRNCRVLTVLSGTPGSMCLVDLVKHSLEVENYKRLNFHHQILIVDNIFLMSHELIEKEYLENIFKQFNQQEMFYLSLADNECSVDVFHIETLLANLASKKDKFTKLQATFASQTAWEDFLEQRTKSYIRKAANHLKCSHVFLPDITVDLAMSVLSNISLGRGASVAHDVGFVDDRMEDVKLLRPIRDFTYEEVKNYIRVNEIHCIENSREYSLESIQSATGKFVADLQSNFSSTVSTIFRTGDKFAPKELNDGMCQFCQSKLDWKESKTIDAVEFSKKISNPQSSSPKIIEGPSEDLCYACQKLLKDCPTIEKYINY